VPKYRFDEACSLVAARYLRVAHSPTSEVLVIRQLSSAFILTLGLAAPALAQTPSAEQIANGKSLFDDNCSACHLATGAGHVKFGTVVSADLRAPKLEDTFHDSDALLQRAILQGEDQNGQPLAAPMSAWSGRLTTDQVEDIIAYLKTLTS
jgi:mono/diheme cytochrome c family protein